MSNEGDLLHGVWLARTATLGGQTLPDEIAHEIRLELRGDKYVVGNDSGRYDHNDDATPRTIDIIGVDGPNAGKHILAIYELEGDALTICYDLSCTHRPEVFESSHGSLELLIHFKRGY